MGNPSQILILLALIHSLPRAHGACYTPNGDDRNDLFVVPNGYYCAPCDPTADVSKCCGIGSGRAEDPDICVHGGLCYNEQRHWFWRESCTDPTWQDPACVKLFLNGTGFDGTKPEYFTSECFLFSSKAQSRGGQWLCSHISASTEALLTQFFYVHTNGSGELETINDVAILACGDGEWCEGIDNIACCQAGNGIFADDTESINAQYGSASAPSSSAGNTVTTATVTAAPSGTLTSGGGLPPDKDAGSSLIGRGRITGWIVVAVIVAVGFCFG